jgi:hypothetical protein
VKRETRPKKLTGKTRTLANKFIAEEVKTGKYPRKQAVAIGISRARAKTAKSRRRSRISANMDRSR